MGKVDDRIPIPNYLDPGAKIKAKPRYESRNKVLN